MCSVLTYSVGPYGCLFQDEPWSCLDSLCSPGSVKALGFVCGQWVCVAVCVSYPAAVWSVCSVWVEFHHSPGLGPIWLPFWGGGMKRGWLWPRPGLLGHHPKAEGGAQCLGLWASGHLWVGHARLERAQVSGEVQETTQLDWARKHDPQCSSLGPGYFTGLYVVWTDLSPGNVIELAQSPLIPVCLALCLQQGVWGGLWSQ